MGKGVTLSKEEIIVLRDLLNGLDITTASKKVVIEDVLYTSSDETFYLHGLSKHIENYKANSIKLVIELLQKDNWNFCGKIQRHDNSRVDMLVKDSEYIAIWEE